MTEGEHFLAVLAVDVSGNKDPSPAQLNIVVGLEAFPLE